MAKKSEDTRLDQTIQAHLPKFQKAGVLTVRPGYEIAGGQLTGKRALVATVRDKVPLADLGPGEALPEHVEGVPVDVRQGSPYQRLRASDPLAAEVSRAYARPEDAEPSWPLEREVDSGRLLGQRGSQTQRRLSQQKVQHKASNRALAGAQSKAQLPYAPAGCPALQRVSLVATVTAAVSPDCGFATLSGFLSGATADLKIGMYDFTSAPILSLLELDLVAPKTLQMVLDSPAPNPTSDQSDWMTVQDLNSSLGTRAHIVRALTRSDHFVKAWSFPSAYHIKLIVRDGSAFWVSSGNLNNSNEPAPNHAKTAEDRDWHVIVENKELADVFAAYLDFDYSTAKTEQADAPADIEKAIEDAHRKKLLQTDPTGTRVHSAKKPQPQRAGPATHAKAQTFKNLQLAVTPLLTPDKLADGQGQYLSEILGLIGGARKSIYIQLQYIESSSGKGDSYDTLLKAIQKRIADGLDVRLIVSANYAQKWGEKMKAGTGVDLTANIRTQPDVHNKGFVIDSSRVVVSSQNFSPAGVSENRDAGVILESPELAGYFEPIFLSDWNHALPFVARGAAKGAAKASKPAAGKKTPAKKGSTKTAASKKAPAKRRRVPRARG